MTIDQYISNISQRYKLGNATEHTFRGDLQQLLESIVPSIRATNEPKRQACGAPDYILTRNEIPIGFIEAKDIGDKDLDGNKSSGNKNQFDRYKGALGNLIFTDYLDFHLYREGVFITKIAIGEITSSGIKAKSESFSAFDNLIKEFCTQVGQTITNSKKLAEMMAGKARLLSEVIENALNSDDDNQENSTLRDQMEAFKEILIHDITHKGFADVYAQTIVYGMFAARLHDPTLPTFSRQEAAELIPKSNPFLRKLFGYIAGPDLDDRIQWIVESLVEIFLACNVEEILKNYGKQTKMEDPIIHFYETFLSEYDPKLRKARGVWYTPAPVVNFIVRAVDDILKEEFGLTQGLADTSKTKIKVESFGKKVEQEVHKVQILDPATGTGTFLAETIKHIHKKFEGQQGIWSNYVEKHLLPRLNGFELLMASYAMAHLQLDLLLKDTGYTPTSNQRLRVYLTNSLEEHHPDTGTLFANWLSTEANEANHIKRDTPVMCIIGNPPYSVSSSNKSKWIIDLLKEYKKGLTDKTLNSLSDDYIKFIRLGHYFIEKNGYGVLAYISANSFLDGVTHRQMRKSLLEGFDKIYIIDLHGNAKRKEIDPDGGKDENVFDIMQGVSINILIKVNSKISRPQADVMHFDLYGNREKKYDLLNSLKISEIKWEKLKCESPYFFFVKKNFDGKTTYDTFFSLQELFRDSNNGIESRKDDVTIHFNTEELNLVKNDFLNLTIDELKLKYGITKESRDWKVEWVKSDLKINDPLQTSITYRPFDNRQTLYTGKSKGFLGYPVNRIMKNMIPGNNFGLLTCKQQSSSYFRHAFITNKISERCSVSLQTRETTFHFPLYKYEEKTELQTPYDNIKRNHNLDMKIVNLIAKNINLTFLDEKSNNINSFAPIDILDYIYAILHSPSYRDKYKEFLKIDFPKIPYPKNKETFWQLVNHGGEIRQIHLLENPVVDNYITQYPVDGDNTVIKPSYQDGKVFINDTQYFDNVPEVAWNFYIGGYQPAQKWLKDRKGRVMEFDDILHYQRIIVALTESDRIMKEIDQIEIE